MLPLLVPLFPVSNDKAVVDSLSSDIVSPLLIVFVRRDCMEGHCGHEGQDGDRTNRSKRHFVMLGLPGEEFLSPTLPEY